MYWVHVIDPPFFISLTRRHPFPCLLPRSVDLPPIGSLENGTHWTPVPPNTTFHSNLLSLCVTTSSTPQYCLKAHNQIWLHTIPKEGQARAQFIFLSAGSLAKGRHTCATAPPLPPCKQNKKWDPSLEALHWEVCRGERPHYYQLGDHQIVDWGPHGHLQANHTNILVQPYLQWHFCGVS